MTSQKYFQQEEHQWQHVCANVDLMAKENKQHGAMYDIHSSGPVDYRHREETLTNLTILIYWVLPTAFDHLKIFQRVNTKYALLYYKNLQTVFLSWKMAHCWAWALLSMIDAQWSPLQKTYFFLFQRLLTENSFLSRSRTLWVFLSSVISRVCSGLIHAITMSMCTYVHLPLLDLENTDSLSLFTTLALTSFLLLFHIESWTLREGV